MSRAIPEYHRRVADRNRSAILAAATELFPENGYDRTSLAHIARNAGVSKATLFKQFPTKALLFEATVLEVGRTPGRNATVPPPGDLHSGLSTLGREYAEVLAQPRTIALIRLVIAESPRFPELRERAFDFGTLPALAALRHYLRVEQEAGSVRADSTDIAATQFLGMIASAIFWPRLVHAGWSIDAKDTSLAIEEAVRTIVARYGA
ncbi:TetR/AcrR family transcriptional regulator [Nocardiopsis sp. MG754419]|uniref:TetR/AcrR family transcriptional regulator n=1 Tax=Nocardiopsis sp. MG754419 TaxID=2259865 RepID=UPI001BA8F83C|nr:TetR/AcrR family transcriptional regulator [Nocardiopsis sp. MG754419]MBR8742681.1 TetR/AcrR family transcriptional regulator [Nocardiopsis sp. MG754419]